MLDKIHHVALQVADIDASVRWYTGSFSCEVLSQGKTSAVLEFNNIRLSLVLPSQEPPHLAFVRDDAGTFGELRQKSDGTQACFVADPTGNLVEVIAP